MLLVAVVAVVIGIGIGVEFGSGFSQKSELAQANSNSPNEKIQEIDNNYNNLNQKIGELSKQIEALSNNSQGVGASNAADGKIATLEKQVKLLEGKLKNVSDDVNDLGQQIAKLKSDNLKLSTTLSADLNKSEYNVGDSLTVTGVGLPNKSVSILLLDADRLTLNQGMAMADSNGEFTFSAQLSKSLAAASYTLQVTQEGKAVERLFKIVGGETPATQQTSTAQGLTISVDRNQYAKGDKVVMTGKADPNTFVDFDIFYSNNVQIRTSVKSDDNGNYRLGYNIPSDAPTGTYEISASVGDKQASVKFSVISSSSTTPSSTSSTSGSLTITTDKTSYKRGDLVKITGKALPSSKVTITAEPPSGDKFLMAPIATDTGNYITLLAIDANAATGNWKLSAKLDSGTDIATTQIQILIG